MKNILLAVVGLSPQVVTETLFALHQSQKSVDAIHVITTRSGQEKILSDLLGGGNGKYFEYLGEYGIEPGSIDFGFNNLHMIKDETGREAADIADEADNEHLLKLCLDLAFHFTNQTDTTVFFSVAGGRKTMSSCLTLAAQMYGRPQDRLYHVLVSPEFENNRDFYFPPKESIKIEIRDQAEHPVLKETKFARVNLIHIPFFSIRNQLSPDLLKEPRDPGTLMMSLIKEEKQQLTLNLRLKKITYRTLEIDLHPVHLTLYAFFAMQKKKCPKSTPSCGACTDCFLEIQDVLDRQKEIKEIYERLPGIRSYEKPSDSGILKLEIENFNSYKSKIKNSLAKIFGVSALAQLEISAEGRRPDTRHGIRMDKNLIEIIY